MSKLLKPLYSWYAKLFSPKVIVPIFLALVAITSRFWQLGKIPAGITWDEAALGYVGRMLVTTFHDEHLNFLPTTLISFGDYKSPLAFYITGVFTYLLDINPFATRLPFVLFGLLSIGLAGYLTWLLWKNVWYSWLATWLVITMPWHFMHSRAGFEVGMTLTWYYLIFIGWLGWRNNLFNRNHLLSKTTKWLDIIKQALWPSLIVIGSIASLYTYHAAKVVVPLTWLAITGYEINQNKSKWLQKSILKQVLLTALISLGLSLPLIYDLFFGLGLERAAQTTIFGQLGWLATGLTIIKNLAAHLSLEFLLWGQTNNLRHITPEFGVFLLGHLLLFWLGITYALAKLINLLARQRRQTLWIKLKDWFRLKSDNQSSISPWFWLIILLITLLPSAVGNQSPHANRAMLAILPTVVLMIVGVAQLRRETSQQVFALVVGGCLLILALQFGDWWRYYFGRYQQQASTDWLVGYESAVKLAYHARQEGKRVKLTDHYGQPFIFYAFYNHLPIEYYRQFRLDNLDLGSIKITDLNHFQLLIAAPEEKLPIPATLEILGSNNQPAFYVYEVE